MSDLVGFYECTPLAAEAAAKARAEQRLRAATEAEVARAEQALQHAEDLREHTDANQATQVQRVRLALLHLQQHVGKAAPASWHRFIAEGLAACAALAPPRPHGWTATPTGNVIALRTSARKERP